MNIDVSAELNGYYGDTGATFLVPPAAPNMALLAATQAALDAALAVARAFVNEIGRAIESTARAAGFTTLRDLGSHGAQASQFRVYSQLFDHRSAPRLRHSHYIEPFLSLALLHHR